MGLSEWFGFGTTGDTGELPNIFPMSVAQHEFITWNVHAIYAKILTDVLERTHGLTDDQTALMWDNCVMSNSQDGLITMLAKAMADKAELFIVYDAAVKVVRKATQQEQARIVADYKSQAKSSVGVYLSFRSFTRSDLVKLFSSMEYATVASLFKSMNLSKAIQIKMSDMRASVSLIDSSDVKAQAKLIATGLGKGNDILLDAKDQIVTSTPDLSATKESVNFLAQKLSFYLGVPASYLTGEQTTGMGSTGENDMRAVERGLKAYYFSIMKPTLEAIFDVSLSYKSQDFRHIAGSMEVLKTFALVDEEFISRENKTRLINQLLDLPEDAKGDEVPEPVALPAPVVPAPGVDQA